ncbi:MAG: DUF4407 domain-containing protein [Bacteroidota bacterium]
MKNWWIKFGCFLIGYNYDIVKNSSEVSAKAVKRYTSALLIVCILWSFIGYTFTNRYVHGGTWGSLVGSLVFVVIIIQIERQIILSINPNKWLYVARGVIAILMAIIGAIIIDQIIFKEDIDLEKITFIETRVKKALIPKTEELRNQIANLDTAIYKKEIERTNLIADIERSPTTLVYSIISSTRTEKVTKIDSTTGKPVTTEKSAPVSVTTSSNVANPKISIIPPLDETIKNLRAHKTEKENSLLNIRPQLEKEISSKVGFLDELEVMYSLITRSGVALSIWLIWLLFLLGLEMLVLISKINEKENDYERTVKHHMNLQIRKLDIIAKMSENSG